MIQITPIHNQPACCPLCRSGIVSVFSRDRRRDFYACGQCSLVFVPSGQFLSREDEKKRYDLHRNSPADQGYRDFLGRLFTPLQRELAAGSAGLDFGSGPEPVLSRMFEEAGHAVTRFDHYYAPDRAALARQYDFIAASEVVEHLRRPDEELSRLWACLKPGGRLGIMTAFVALREDFSRWHYKNDPTHVCFYSPETFSWLAVKWNADMEIAGSNVVLFRKKPCHY